MSIYQKYPDLRDDDFIADYSFDVCWTVANPDSPFHELDVAVALIRAKGNFSAAARYLCRTRRTLETFVTRDTDLSDLFEDIEAEFLDDIESKLKTVAQSDPATMKFFLKTKGKNRGYNERAELSGPDGGPLELEVSPREILNDKLTRIAAALGADGAVEQPDGS